MSLLTDCLRIGTVVRLTQKLKLLSREGQIGDLIHLLMWHLAMLPIIFHESIVNVYAFKPLTCATHHLDSDTIINRYTLIDCKKKKNIDGALARILYDIL